MPGHQKLIIVFQNIRERFLCGWSYLNGYRGRVLSGLVVLVILQAGCSFPLMKTGQSTQTPTPLVVPSETLVITDTALPPTPTTPAPTGTAANTLTPVLTNTPETRPSPEIVAEHSKISVDIPKYTIETSKPVLSGGKYLAEDFNLLVDAAYQDQIDDFIGMVEDNETFRSQNLPEFGSYLDLRYETAHISNELISLSIPVEVYLAGMAHPNHFTIVINYDLSKNRSLQLDDLFQSEEQILPVLAAICENELTKRQELFFEDGVLPEPENYQNWMITEQGFVVIFDPYHVAPYAAGTITVNIPWERLSDEINPLGPLVRFQPK